MLIILENSENLKHDSEKIPVMDNISKDTKMKINLEICERHFRFDKIQFFRVLPKLLWLEFFKCLEMRLYNIGDIIYHKGEKPTHFYIIKSGEVWFMENQEEIGTYPFVQIDSYFGEIELLKMK